MEFILLIWKVILNIGERTLIWRTNLPTYMKKAYFWEEMGEQKNCFMFSEIHYADANNQLNYKLSEKYSLNFFTRWYWGLFGIGT